MLTQREQRKAAKEFSIKWKDIGYEKGDSAKFWLSLLNEVYGIEKPAEFIRFEDKVVLDHTSFIDAYIPSTHVLIEQKSIDKDLRKGIRQSDGTLLSPFQQAKRYSIELPYSERPRWIVLSNFQEFHIFDMEKPGGEPEVIYLKNLEEDYYRLNFLIDEENTYIKKATEVSIKAGELVGLLYDALLKQYKNQNDEETLKDLNILCVRLVFCFYAEDAGIFGRHNMFHDYLAKYRNSKSSFREALINLFIVLDQKEHERDPYLSDNLLAFPYVNGGLFEKEDVVIPRISEDIIDIILDKASANFNWAKISPTIFGGVFESTLNPETRRASGMHYTSIENIHKVIDPLFMNKLWDEYKEIKNLKTLSVRERRFSELQDKMASLKFLDPAAGSGNFLTETYISLRKLENEILKEIHGIRIVIGAVHNPIKVSINQFYGIEINDFAVSVARTALWIAESQMMKETEDIVNMNLDFLPLKTYPNIVEGNALRMDWEKVVSKNKLNYIMGNPPFIGKKEQNENQKNELKMLYLNHKGIGKLDYVTGWYAKAIEFIRSTKIEVAFVSTNSITQGEQVPVLWSYLIKKNIVINFAYQSFIWNSEALDLARVHCVIIGFSTYNLYKEKYLFSNKMQVKKVNNINPYLLNAPNVLIDSRSKPISKVKPISYGNMPIDNGHLILSKHDVKDLLNENPNNIKFIKKYIGGNELINGTTRWCLWLKNVSPKEIQTSKLIMKRVKLTHDFRKNSNRKQTRELANIPYLFGEIRQPTQEMLVIPKVSSEKRKYIPMDFVSCEVIVNGSALIISKAELYDFGILTSNVHMAWMRVVAGRMEMRYQYSNNIVYNNFPWPQVSEFQKEKIKKTAKMILKARKLYPDSNLAHLYNEFTMPPELRKAHQENDKAVMEAYGFNWRNMTESECVGELMKLYTEHIQKESRKRGKKDV